MLGDALLKGEVRSGEAACVKASLCGKSMGIRYVRV